MAVKIGIIGTGGISACHMNGYKKLGNLVEVVACCDIDFPKAQNYARMHGIPNVYDNCEQMLNECKLDAVSVCTWNSAHKDCTIAALNAGVNVLCEKPMAMNALEAKEMEQAAEKNKKLLMIGFVRRFGNDCSAAKDFIEKDFLGEIYYAKASYIRRAGFPGGWFGNKEFSGGGPLIDLGVHIIDLSRYLLGKPKPVSVYGATFSKLGPRRNLKTSAKAWTSTTKTQFPIFNVEDMAAAFIKFDNGSLLSVETSFGLNVENEYNNVELFGTKAGLSLSPFKLYGEVNDMLADITIKGPTGADFNEIFNNEIAHYVNCVATGSQCLNPAEDGVELMKILDAVYLSSETGKSIDIE